MVNNWWELQIICQPDLEDSLFWRLEKFGCKGMATEKKGNACVVKAYLHGEQAQLLDLAALSIWLRQDALVMGLSVPKMQWQLIDEEDWASSWKEHWQPQEIGDRFLIYPAWLPVPAKSDRLLLRLDPGTAFGTGNHATTQLCLEGLEMRLDEDSAGAIVADIGCGSGILAIGAVLLGSGKVYAVDNDLLAIKSARKNRQLNQILPQQLVIEHGSVDTLHQLSGDRFDGIVCNILAEVIIELIPQMSAIAKPSTWGILSGILVEQSQSVTDTLEKHGWTVAAIWRRQEWCSINIRRS